METKVCTRCGTEKPVDSFSMRYSKKTRLSWCKSCTLEWQRGHYHSSYKTTEKCVNKYLRRKAKIGDRKQQAVEYKGGRCEVCGYSRYVGALEFHHIDPSQKDFRIGSRVGNSSWETLTNELDKCRLLCSNCHKELHYGLRNGVSSEAS